jgi:hypothetical protein
VKRQWEAVEGVRSRRGSSSLGLGIRAVREPGEATTYLGRQLYVYLPTYPLPGNYKYSNLKGFSSLTRSYSTAFIPPFSSAPSAAVQAVVGRVGT